MVGVGGSDAMDYHALEAMQCMVERRKGGETGVKSVQMLEGDAVWKAGEDGLWSRRLLEAALSRSDSLQGDSERDSRTQDLAEQREAARPGEGSRRLPDRAERRPPHHPPHAQRGARRTTPSPPGSPTTGSSRPSSSCPRRRT